MGKRIDPSEDLVYTRVGMPPRLKKRMMALVKREAISMSGYIRSLVTQDLKRRKAKRDALNKKT